MKGRRYTLAYRAANPLEAHLVRNVLEANGISVEIVGEQLAGGVGELPVDVLQVEVRTAPDKVAHARQLIREHQDREIENEKSWTCPFCGEENDEQFEICWRCEKDRPPFQGD